MVKNRGERGGKLSALAKGLPKLQKSKVIIHKIAKEIFNKNKLDYGLEGRNHTHTHPCAHMYHPHT